MEGFKMITENTLDVGRTSAREETERRGWVLNTAASYSGGPVFKPRPGDRLSWLAFLVVFLIPSRKMPE
jgi:hypothetical protein